MSRRINPADTLGSSRTEIPLPAPRQRVLGSWSGPKTRLRNPDFRKSKERRFLEHGSSREGNVPSGPGSRSPSGELAAFKWEDVNLRSSTSHVTRSVVNSSWQYKTDGFKGQTVPIDDYLRQKGHAGWSDNTIIQESVPTVGICPRQPEPGCANTGQTASLAEHHMRYYSNPKNLGGLGIRRGSSWQTFVTPFLLCEGQW